MIEPVCGGLQSRGEELLRHSTVLIRDLWTDGAGGIGLHHTGARVGIDLSAASDRDWFRPSVIQVSDLSIYLYFLPGDEHFITTCGLNIDKGK